MERYLHIHRYTQVFSWLLLNLSEGHMCGLTSKDQICDSGHSLTEYFANCC